MVSVDQARQLFGVQVVDADGDTVGTVNEVYLDDETDRLSWVTIATGWFGLGESFVPLDRADIGPDRIRVPFDKATIKNAPRYQSGAPLTPQDEDGLYRHYDIPINAADPTTEQGAGTDTTGYANDTGRRPATTIDRSNTNEPLIRSKEQLDSGTEPVPIGRARLRKYVITEQQTVSIPLSHEEVRIKREPITDQDQLSSGVELTDDELEIVLHAERPVVTTESVPVEKVRLDTYEETVRGKDRKDQSELADNTPGSRGND